MIHKYFTSFVLLFFLIQSCSHHKLMMGAGSIKRPISAEKNSINRSLLDDLEDEEKKKKKMVLVTGGIKLFKRSLALCVIVYL